MEIKPFDKGNRQFIKEAAGLLRESFPHSYADCADEEMERCLDDSRVAVMALEDGRLVGFVGAIPQYGTTGWELHPLVVQRDYQFKGIGTMLIRRLEEECASRGGVTIYLGTDDEFGQNTLSGTDLYEDTYQKITAIQNVKGHPYQFYQKAGYKIMGVIPDANGIGKPDIWMAKRIIKHMPQ